MKVSVTFDFSDDERDYVARYWQLTYGERVPSPASSSLLRKWVLRTIYGRFMAIADELAEEAEREARERDTEAAAGLESHQDSREPGES